MGFVENPNFVAVSSRTITGGVTEFADFIDATVGGSIDLDDINGIPRPYFNAGFANSARLGHGLVRRAAIQRHSENASYGGFANPAVPAEDVATRNSALLDSVL